MFQEGDSDNQKDNPIISRQTQKVYLSFNKPSQKLIILNLPNQSYDQKLGRVEFKTEIDLGQVQIKQETEGRKKEMVKKEYPTLKTSFWGSKNPKKVFSFAIPYGRTVRKSNDSKIHFLFELGQENNSLLTVVDDYCDTSFDIVEGKDARERLQKKSLNEAVERQKRLLDARRINTNQMDYKDPDFNVQGQDSDD